MSLVLLVSLVLLAPGSRASTLLALLVDWVPAPASAVQMMGGLLKQQNPSRCETTQEEHQAVPLFAKVCQKASACTNRKRNKRILGAHLLGTAEQTACFIQQGAAAIPGAEIQLVEA